MDFSHFVSWTGVRLASACYLKATTRATTRAITIFNFNPAPTFVQVRTLEIQI